MIDAARLMAPLVRRFEGLHKLVAGLVFPYICPAGYWTQGYGLLVKDGKAPPITVAEAEVRVEGAMPGYIAQTLRLCPRLANEPPERLAAIADFTFNLGAGRLKVSTLRRRVNEGDWDAVDRELRKWTRGGGRVLPGLVLRREAEIALMRGAGGVQAPAGGAIGGRPVGR